MNKYTRILKYVLNVTSDQLNNYIHKIYSTIQIEFWDCEVTELSYVSTCRGAAINVGQRFDS